MVKELDAGLHSMQVKQQPDHRTRADGKSLRHRSLQAIKAMTPLVVATSLGATDSFDLALNQDLAGMTIYQSKHRAIDITSSYLLKQADIKDIDTMLYSDILSRPSTQPIEYESESVRGTIEAVQGLPLHEQFKVFHQHFFKGKRVFTSMMRRPGEEPQSPQDQMFSYLREHLAEGAEDFAKYLQELDAKEIMRFFDEADHGLSFSERSLAQRLCLVYHRTALLDLYTQRAEAPDNFLDLLFGSVGLDECGSGVILTETNHAEKIDSYLSSADLLVFLSKQRRKNSHDARALGHTMMDVLQLIYNLEVTPEKMTAMLREMFDTNCIENLDAAMLLYKYAIYGDKAGEISKEELKTIIDKQLTNLGQNDFDRILSEDGSGLKYLLALSSRLTKSGLDPEAHFLSLFENTDKHLQVLDQCHDSYRDMTALSALPNFERVMGRSIESLSVEEIQKYGAFGTTHLEVELLTALFTANRELDVGNLIRSAPLHWARKFSDESAVSPMMNLEQKKYISEVLLNTLPSALVDNEGFFFEAMLEGLTQHGDTKLKVILSELIDKKPHAIMGVASLLSVDLIDHALLSQKVKENPLLLNYLERMTPEAPERVIQAITQLVDQFGTERDELGRRLADFGLKEAHRSPYPKKILENFLTPKEHIQKPTVLMVRSNEDWNHAALLSNYHDFFEQYHVLITSADNEHELHNRLMSGTVHMDGIDILILEGHGSAERIALGAADPRFGSQENESLYLDIADGHQLKYAMSNYVKPGGNVILLSCKNGEGEKKTKNLANVMSDIAPQTRIHSMTDSGNGLFKFRDGLFSEVDFGVDSYIIEPK